MSMTYVYKFNINMNTLVTHLARVTLNRARGAPVFKVILSTLPPQPVIPSKKPFKVELSAGKRYSWCSCGLSEKQPFCDGSHKTQGSRLLPLRFVQEEDATVWLCGCKHTNKPPFCDGTHKQNFIVSASLHQHPES
uniref:CDGSH iron-sulfur domain-containing protein 3, mitochondrial-like n=1 Tax=Oryzias melastigma TaxID=30732 RepID=A0A3B3CJJ0_ORYME